MTTSIVHHSSNKLPLAKPVIVDGFTYSAQLARLMDDIIECNVEFSTSTQLYDMKFESLSEFHTEQLSAQFLADEPHFLSEVTTPEYPEFNQKMMPALINMLKDSTNKEKVYEFVTEWRDGVSKRLITYLRELFDSRLADYNLEFANDAWREIYE